MAATREFSAGGVIVRRAGAGFTTVDMAVIQPRGKTKVRALPKGHVDPGETPEQTAVREVREETGLNGKSHGKLGDVKYTYRFDGKSIFKIVSFYLLELESGEIDQLTEAMRIEVDRAFWLPLHRAVTELSYPGERQMAQKALERVSGW
jgi:8-oxo-dGTP pyrophosphatase MutT (NUDIX family)